MPAGKKQLPEQWHGKIKNNIQSYDLKHVLLKEEKTIDQAGRELEAEVARVESQNQVDKVLDRSLKIAKRKQRSGDTGDFPNILLVSDAGFGKTDMVRQWAKKNGINLVQKNLGTMGPEAFGGIVARDADDPRYATRLGTNEMIKALEKPNSVLFLDEYNRSKTEVRGAVLTLVQNHMVWDPTEENQEKFLDNFLFTVAAINPPNAAYKGAKEMDPAEMSRFYTVNMQPDPMEHLKYLRSFYTEKIEGAAGDAISVKYYSGKGPKTGDVVVLKKGGKEVICNIVSIESDSFSFEISPEVETGKYSFCIRRGDLTKAVRDVQFNIEIRVEVAEKEGYNIYGIITCDEAGVPGVVVSDGGEVTVTDENGIYYLKSEEYNRVVFMSVPSGYETVAEGVVPKIHKVIDGNPATIERVDWTLTKVDNTDHILYVLGDMHLANRTNDISQFNDFVTDIKTQINANKAKNKESSEEEKKED